MKFVMEKAKLLLVPFAGGCSFNYKHILELLSDKFDCICFDSKGHGVNAGKPFNTSFAEEKAEFVEFIKANTSDSNYVVWGYSFGGIIVFEALRDIQRAGLPLPKKVFLAGVKPPFEFTTPNPKPMTDEDLMPFLLSMNENKDPEGVLKHMDEIRPALQICANYQYEGGEKLKVDACVMSADEDVVTEKGVDNWVKYIDGEVKFGRFHGKHFFYRQDTENVVKFIKENA